jgi:hypothetical protein
MTPKACFFRSALCLVLGLGGCIGWNETGLWRAERRVRRSVQPGMTELEVEAAMERADIDYDQTRTGDAGHGCLGDVQCIYIGTASLHFTVLFDGESKVRDVSFSVTTSCL